MATMLLGASSLLAWTDVVVDAGNGANASLEVVNGRPAIAYVGAGGVRYVRATDARGLTWGAPMVVDSTSTRGASLAIVDGNPAIASGTGSEVRFVRALDPDGVSWGTPVMAAVPGIPLFVGSPSLAVVSGTPAIAFIASGSGLTNYVRALDPDGAAWGTPVVVGMFAQEIDSDLAMVNGRPAILHAAYGGCVYYTRASDATGAAWPSPTCIFTTPFTETETPLTIVAGNPATMSREYIDFAHPFFVRADDPDGIDWSQFVYLRDDSCHDEMALRVVGGLPAMAFQSRQDVLRYRRALDPVGSTWGPLETVDPALGTGRDVSLVGLTDGAGLAYVDVPNADLKYAFDCFIDILPATLPHGSEGVPYSQALSGSGGTPPYLFAIDGGALPPGISLSSSGLVSGTPTLSGIYDFTVAITDAVGCPHTQAYRLTICPTSCPGITVLPATLPRGKVGDVYYEPLLASGGTEPYSFAVTGGSLPPGLTLVSDWALQGTPSSAGAFTFTLTVTDTCGCTGSKTYTLLICRSSCPVIQVDPPALPPAIVGTAYSQLLTASGGFDPYAFLLTAGALPPGLTLLTSGQLSGTPSTVGSYAFTVDAVDGCSCRGSRAYVLTVSCPQLSIAPTTIPAGQVGSPYAVAFTASGGQPPYSFTSTSLPPGLALSASGLLDGTPTTSGSFPLDVTVTDAGGCAVTGSYVLIVSCGTVAIAPASLPSGQVGVPYAVTFTASGGLAPYVFTSTIPPPGLTLSPGGLLDGTPTAAGSFPIDVTATDAGGCDGTRSYVLVIDTASVVPADVLAGQGLGAPNPNRVRVFDATGAPVAVDFLAYAAGQWGVNVAAADIDGPDHAEILTGPGPGAVFGPQVRGFVRDGTPKAKVNYYAYGTLRYGVNVAAGDLEPDGFAEVLSGAGPGSVFGPHVRGWNVDGQAVTPIGNVSFFAYGTLQYGVNVGEGDVEGDGAGEILSGPGPSAVFGAVVRGFDVDGGPVSGIAKINFSAFPLTYGVLVAAGDVDADGFDEILSAAGPGPANPAWIRGYDYDGAGVAPIPGLDGTLTGSLYGGRVGAGDLDASSTAELVVGRGPDPAAGSELSALVYTGTSLVPLVPQFTAFPGSFHGANATVGPFGY